MRSSRCGVVFDLDETLINRRGSLDRYALALFNSFDRDPAIDEKRFLQIFHDLDGNGRVPRDAFFKNLALAAFDDTDPALIANHFREHAWRNPLLFEGVTHVIEQFKSNAYAIGIVTNGSSHSQNAKIMNSGLSPYLDAWVISEEFGRKKPDPAIYSEIAHRLDIDPHRSWFIGDDPISDVVGPAQHGFKTAWLERYLPWPADRDECYTHRVRHIAELSRALFGDAQRGFNQ